MKITYQPKGVCSKQMEIEMDGTVIRSVHVVGGCNGNLKGICALVKGRDARDVIPLLQGITCGARPTSCPDQLAAALEGACKQAMVK